MTDVVTGVFRDIGLLHPRCLDKFSNLARVLSDGYARGVTKTRFLPFETYRTPQRQHWLSTHQGKVTKAGQFQSAHQFGLACDFVPYVNIGSQGVWSWDLEHDWAYLRAQAEEAGLDNDISWDRPHVEDPIWKKIRWDLKVPSAVNRP